MSTKPSQVALGTMLVPLGTMFVVIGTTSFKNNPTAKFICLGVAVIILLSALGVLASMAVKHKRGGK